jgi:outer membrane protein assembly factor BamB
VRDVGWLRSRCSVYKVVTTRRFAWLFAFVVATAASCRPPASVRGDGNTRTIAPLWQITFGDSQTILAIAAVTPRIVVVDGIGKLVGLEPTSGRRIWSLPIPFMIPYAGVEVVRDDLAALVTGDGYVIFDPRDGRLIKQWVEPRPRRHPSGTIPQTLSDGRIIYVSRARDLMALDAVTGRLDTLTKLPGDSIRHPYVVSLSVFRDTIYAPVASDARRGAAFRNTVPYRFAVATRVLDSLQPDPSDSASLTKWMLPYEQLLVSATDYSEPSWLAFDRATGLRRWKVAAAAASLGPFSQVAVVGDTLFGGGNDGVAYIIHVPSGRLIRTLPIPNGLVAGVVACGGDVFFNVIGQLTGFSRDGRQRIRLTGLPEGKDAFGGAFTSGAGITVIGDGAGSWTAFTCAPPV